MALKTASFNCQVNSVKLVSIGALFPLISNMPLFFELVN